MQQYETMLNNYAKALSKVEGVEQIKRAASRDRQWHDQGLDTSKHPEVLVYQIRWFNGRWSGWLVPGFNDREKGKGRNVRHWGCFADHQHEVILTTRKELYREIQDLP